MIVIDEYFYPCNLNGIISSALGIFSSFILKEEVLAKKKLSPVN